MQVGGSHDGTSLFRFASAHWPGLERSLRFQSAVTNITSKCEVVGKEKKGRRERRKRRGGERESTQAGGEDVS